MSTSMKESYDPKEGKQVSSFSCVAKLLEKKMLVFK